MIVSSYASPNSSYDLVLKCVFELSIFVRQTVFALIL